MTITAPVDELPGMAGIGTVIVADLQLAVTLAVIDRELAVGTRVSIGRTLAADGLGAVARHRMPS